MDQIEDQPDGTDDCGPLRQLHSNGSDAVNTAMPDVHAGVGAAGKENRPTGKERSDEDGWDTEVSGRCEVCVLC